VNFFDSNSKDLITKWFFVYLNVHEYIMWYS